MIKVMLSGGLGNQMFQYAFARTLSIKHNTTLVLDTSYLQSKLPFSKLATQMKYELGVFDIEAKVETNYFSGKYLYPFAKAEYLLKKKLNKIRLDTITESDFSFQKELFNSSDNSFIRGNFQSEKYFKIIEDLLRKEFTFKPTLDIVNLNWIQKMKEGNTVAIHVRRGDYVSLKQNVNKFAQIPIAYYQKAIQYLSERVPNTSYFIFSDDIQWVRKHLQLEDYPCYFIENNLSADKAYIDMQLMSNCKHNIIANSTFSWWSAWLNNNPDKIVIAPQQWFADVSINSNDIIPDEWIKL